MIEFLAIKEVLAKVLKLDPQDVSDNASMSNMPEWDSLRQLTLILTLEDQFNVEIPDIYVQNLTSLKYIHEWLNSSE